MNAAVRESLQRAIALTGITGYPVEVWIDDDGYLRRMRTTIPQRIPGAPAEVATVTATEELSNFGTDVRIAVPPDSSVVDISDLGG